MAASDTFCLSRPVYAALAIESDVGRDDTSEGNEPSNDSLHIGRLWLLSELDHSMGKLERSTLRNEEAQPWDLHWGRR